MKRMYKNNCINIVLIIVLFLSFLAMTSFAQEEKIIIKLGHHHNVGGLVDKLSNKFKEIAEEKSGGRLRIDIFPGAQLGQEREASEGILMGTLQMTVVTDSNYDNTVNGFGISILPFVYDSFEQQIRIFNDSPVGKELDAKLLEKGGRILGWLVPGSRSMIFTDKEVKTLEDMKGLKMRSPESDLFISMFKALGTQPTSITWGEAYTALQTGVADGMESPPGMIKDMQFYEVTKYCLLTNHMWGAMNLIINENLFQKLPEDIQKVIIEAGREAIDYANQFAIEDQEKATTWLEEQGMVFYELTEEERGKFKEALLPVDAQWVEKHEATALFEKIQELTK
jgi:tripartite ATP-independent transporter DctP family solute receptor